MNQFESTKETQITNDGSDISFIQGEDLFGIPPKEGKTYENKNDFLFIDEKSNVQ